MRPKRRSSSPRRTDRPPRAAPTAAPPTPEAALRAVRAAFDRRRPLLASEATDAVRLFHGAADGIDGLVVEKFGPMLIAQLHEGRLALADSLVRSLCEELAALSGATSCLPKRFVRDRSTAAAPEPATTGPWFGDPPPESFAVRELGAAFVIRPGAAYSVGLFLDQRDNRRRARALAAERAGTRVLNTFAYTCGFSICAALAGAAQTTSVDASAAYLDWGRENFAANGLDAGGAIFIRDDVLAFLGRALRQGRSYELVILDAPTFGRSKQAKTAFSLATDLEKLMRGAVAVTSPDGVILLSVNHRGTPLARLEQACAAACAGRAWEIFDRPAPPEDFAGDVDYSRSLWLRVGPPASGRTM